MKQNTFKIELTESQRWLVIKALCYMVEPDNMSKLIDEFPEINQQKYVDDLRNLIKKLKNG